MSALLSARSQIKAGSQHCTELLPRLFFYYSLLIQQDKSKCKWASKAKSRSKDTGDARASYCMEVSTCKHSACTAAASRAPLPTLCAHPAVLLNTHRDTNREFTFFFFSSIANFEVALLQKVDSNRGPSSIIREFIALCSSPCKKSLLNSGGQAITQKPENRAWGHINTY